KSTIIVQPLQLQRMHIERQLFQNEQIPAQNQKFFFSSRRRHTRSKRDWSSDVCSSDLDSFSALDFKTDANLRRALKEEVTDASIVIVAQRVSSVMDADRILVLENGEVKGIGTHNELLKM